MILIAVLAMAFSGQVDPAQAAPANGAAASAPSPPSEPGQEKSSPLDVPLMPGDSYGTAVLQIDKTGHVVECGIKNTNIRDQEKIFYWCQLMKSDWHMQPLMKDGAPVAGTVERRMVMRGPQGERAVEQAWRRYQATHPGAKRAD